MSLAQFDPSGSHRYRDHAVKLCAAVCWLHSTVQTKRLPLHSAPQSGAHELRIAPVSLQLSSMHPAVVYLQHCMGRWRGVLMKCNLRGISLM